MTTSKYITRSFTLAELDELEDRLQVQLPYDLMDQQYEEDMRWAEVFSGVLEIDGEFWRFDFFKDKTEMGLESPWAYGYTPDTVEAVKVEKVRVTVDKWMEVIK